MTNLACLHFLCGKAGAGKSTLATALAGDYGAILIKNGVPIGYGYAALLFA